MFLVCLLNLPHSSRYQSITFWNRISLTRPLGLYSCFTLLSFNMALKVIKCLCASETLNIMSDWFDSSVFCICSWDQGMSPSFWRMFENWKFIIVFNFFFSVIRSKTSMCWSSEAMLEYFKQNLLNLRFIST